MPIITLNNNKLKSKSRGKKIDNLKYIKVKINRLKGIDKC